MHKYGIATPFRIASFLGSSMQEMTWMSALQEGYSAGKWYAPWFGRGFLQLTHAEIYIEYWRWIGRSVPESLKTALQNAAAQAHRAESNAGLQDLHFPALTQQMKDWRDNVAGNPNPLTLTAEKLRAPSDSAGHYAVINNILKYADENHDIERVEVAVVNNVGAPQGTKVYYRSSAFWKVSAAVNLPGAVNRRNYRGINGFDSRCSGYGVALAVLTELSLPSSTQGLTVDYPEGYTKRSQ